MKTNCARLHTICFVLLLSLSVSQASLAQVNSLPSASAVESLPGVAQPGRIEQEFKSLRVPKSNAKAFVPGQRNLIVPEGAEDILIEIKQLQFDGVTLVKPAIFEEQFSDLIGKEVSLADLYAVANKITTMYRNMGYVLSQAVIPEQEIDESGVATIQVIEGYVKRVNVDGIEDEQQRQRILAVASKISTFRPLNIRVLERYLLILNDFGGVDFSATLAPSDELGAADISLKVSKNRSSISLNLENRGTDSIGPERLTGQVTINSLISQFDSNSLTAVTTGNDELAYVSISNTSQLGNEGLTISTTLSQSSSKPGGDLSILEIENESTTLSLDVEYPLIRSRTKNLSLRSSFELFESESIRLASAEGSEALTTEDELRSVRLGLVFDNLDRYRGINLLDVELSKGLDVLGASQEGDAGLSRELGDPEYSKLTFYAARLQSIAPNWSILFSLNGQYSNDNLLSSEQFGIGGRNFGSAFDSSEIIGDSGIAGRIELRYSKTFNRSPIKNAVFYGFVDGGEIERNAPSTGQAEQESLSSYGIGVRYRLRRLSGYLEYALPNNRDIASEGNDDPRLFFSLKSSL